MDDSAARDERRNSWPQVLSRTAHFGVLVAGNEEQPIVTHLPLRVETDGVTITAVQGWLARGTELPLSDEQSGVICLAGPFAGLALSIHGTFRVGPATEASALWPLIEWSLARLTSPVLRLRADGGRPAEWERLLQQLVSLEFRPTHIDAMWKRPRPRPRHRLFGP